MSQDATPLESYIRQRLQRKKMLLMTHAVVGYPDLDANMRMLEAMQQADVDLVELQLPFSEPIADGPVFLRANQGALDAGMNWEQYFQFMQQASRAFDFKVLMMGYYNSVFRMGHETFCNCVSEHGGSGFIVADLPPQEGQELFTQADAQRLSPIVLMTPTNSEDRLRQLAQYARGFVYCVARKGVTGTQTDIDPSLEAFIARCRNATSLPLALGFGLRSGAELRQVCDLVDIGIVGTALLEAWEAGASRYQKLLRELSAATVA
ncbi:MAG: tryptophan synthase subunit alpha [Candidatus Tectomicrobia bacterium]|nr:tryptophan synthase subunit alpha [Candidatus Tectomicrobia bacterium]